MKHTDVIEQAPSSLTYFKSLKTKVVIIKLIQTQTKSLLILSKDI